MSWDDSLQELSEATRDAFSVPVVYTPVGGEPVTLNAVFDKIPKVDKLLGGMDHSYLHPTLDVTLSDLGVNPEKEDIYLIDDERWKVLKVTMGRVSASLQIKRVS